MQFKNIKDVFEAHLGHIVFNSSFKSQIKQLRLNWTSKKDVNGHQYSEFLGSNLLGVHPVRYSEQDEYLFFVNTLNVDPTILKDDLHSLPDIHKERSVSSNVSYLTMLYLGHKFATSNMSKNDRIDAILEIYYLFAYKAMSSLITHYFNKYNLDIAIAKAVFERLSEKFILKKKGNWQGVFTHQAGVILPDGIYYPKLVRFNTIDATDIASGLQTRIRDLFKNVYSVIREVSELDHRINTSSLIGSIGEDEDGFIDTMNAHDGTITYINSILPLKTDFVDSDIVYLVSYLIGSDEDHVKTTLMYMSDLAVEKKLYNNLTKDTLNITFRYLRDKRITHDYNTKILEIIQIMKGYWSASSVKDKDVLQLKKETKNIIRKATGVETDWVISKINITVLIYIFVRAIKR
jgi:hypothetical protein